jgi:hypothetical protein
MESPPPPFASKCLRLKSPSIRQKAPSPSGFRAPSLHCSTALAFCSPDNYFLGRCMRGSLGVWEALHEAHPLIFTPTPSVILSAVGIAEGYKMKKSKHI